MKLQRLSADLGVRWAQAFDPGPASTPFSSTGRTRRWPPTDEQFVDMLRAYRAWGGLARRSEFEANLEARSSMGPSVLSAWIADAVVFEFEWGGQSWIPRFQFLPAALTPRPGTEAGIRQRRAGDLVREAQRPAARAQAGGDGGRGIRGRARGGAIRPLRRRLTRREASTGSARSLDPIVLKAGHGSS